MEYYPRVVSWCIDKNLPMFANSDEHGIISEDYATVGYGTECLDGRFVRFRPMTLVLAQEKSQEAVKEALLEGRTIAYTDNKFMSTEEYLVALFDACVEVQMSLQGDKKNTYICTNKSSFPFVFEVNGGGQKTLPPFSTITFSIPSRMAPVLTILNMWCYEDRHPVVRR
ncbi:MAG: hypothetical protein J6S16_06500, partial [Bacteroidales bacterium]|nr:hypothetical protein [Bacteroidales bacterium]